MRPTTSTVRWCAVAVAGAALLAGSVLAGPAGAFPAGSFAGSLLRGAADGGSASLSNGSTSVLSLGPVARQALGCNPLLGQTPVKSSDEVNAQLNFLGSITLPVPQAAPALVAQQLRNSGYVTATDTAADVYEQATSSSVDLLDGVVRATTLKETAHTRLDAGGYRSDADSVFQDLLVDFDGAGPQQPVAIPHPTPNQTISLGPIGKLVLNEQVPSGRGMSASALHLYVGDYAGFHGDLVVGHVVTQVGKAPGRLSGYAYASQGSVKPLLASGRQAYIALACNGTGGADKTTTGARLTVPGSGAMPTLLDEAALTSTVNALASATEPYSRTSARIEGLRLLVDASGVPLVSADAVQSRAYTYAGFDRPAYDATGVKTPVDGIRSTGATDLVNLVVNGQVIAGPVPPNTRIDLPGIGNVVLNEQRCKDSTSTTGAAACSSTSSGTDTHYDAITVSAVHVTITVSGNPSGLPVGAQIVIGQSHSDLAF